MAVDDAVIVEPPDGVVSLDACHLFMGSTRHQDDSNLKSHKTVEELRAEGLTERATSLEQLERMKKYHPEVSGVHLRLRPTTVASPQEDGADEGLEDGADDGADDGLEDGADDGLEDGADEGADEGANDGKAVGASV